MESHNIKWLEKNYTESKEECLVWLSQFEKEGCYTNEDFIEGLKELRKFKHEKGSIFDDLKILNELSAVGIRAYIAGVMLREAIDASYKLNNRHKYKGYKASQAVTDFKNMLDGLDKSEPNDNSDVLNELNKIPIEIGYITRDKTYKKNRNH